MAGMFERSGRILDPAGIISSVVTLSPSFKMMGKLNVLSSAGARGAAEYWDRVELRCPKHLEVRSCYRRCETDLGDLQREGDLKCEDRLNSLSRHRRLQSPGLPNRLRHLGFRSDLRNYG